MMDKLHRSRWSEIGVPLRAPRIPARTGGSKRSGLFLASGGGAAVVAGATRAVCAALRRFSLLGRISATRQIQRRVSPKTPRK
jgi:hypothetical protein